MRTKYLIFIFLGLCASLHLVFMQAYYIINAAQSNFLITIDYNYFQEGRMELVLMGIEATLILGSFIILCIFLIKLRVNKLLQSEN